MALTHSKCRDDIVEASVFLSKLGFTIGPAGNISCRVPSSDIILITPSGVKREELTPEDIMEVNIDGFVLSGHLKPSRELDMHLKIYKTRPEAGAVIHSHPTYSTVLSIVGEGIPPITDEFVVFVGNGVNIAKYAISGSRALADNAEKAMGGSKAVLLSNHGLLCYGRDLEEALFITRLVENAAEIFVNAKQLGNWRSIPEKSLRTLLEWYEKNKYK